MKLFRPAFLVGVAVLAGWWFAPSSTAAPKPGENRSKPAPSSWKIEADSPDIDPEILKNGRTFVREAANLCQDILLVKVISQAGNADTPMMRGQCLFSIKGKSLKEINFYDYQDIYDDQNGNVSRNPLGYRGELGIGDVFILFFDSYQNGGGQLHWQNCRYRDSIVSARYYMELASALPQQNVFAAIRVVKCIYPGEFEEASLALLLNDDEIKIDPVKAREWIDQLDDPDFNRREQASRALSLMGVSVLPQLAEVAGNGSPEASDRAITLLKKYRLLVRFFDKLLNWNPTPVYIDLLENSPENKTVAWLKLKKTTGRNFDAQNVDGWKEWHLKNPDATGVRENSMLGLLRDYTRRNR